MNRTVAAVDLGAESGRVCTVSFDGTRLHLDVAARFSHTAAVRDGLLRWDIDGLWADITAGLGAVAAGDAAISSVGVDTWGVDYGLLDGHGRLLDGPVSYRDPRNAATFAAALAEVGADRLYDATGVQLLPINTVFALMADARTRPERLAAAHTMLMMPDVFHHRLSGATATEYTAASTTGAYDLTRGGWAKDLLDQLGVPTHMLPEVLPPGTDTGPIVGDLATGALARARVVLPAGHDTACAVVGAPLDDPHALFLSSGTWSLAGIETARPVISRASQAADLTNEGGYGEKVLVLRNLTGLWLLQECRRQWAREGVHYSYPVLAELAAAEPGLAQIVDAADPIFLAPGDMPHRIREWSAQHGFPVPESVGQVARCVVDALALSYRSVTDDLEAVTGQRPTVVNVVGGGAHHTLLSQLTADATGLPVRCGPVEATALGNGAVQLAALGEFAGIDEIRQAVAASAEIVQYAPRSDDRWDAAMDRLRRIRPSVGTS